MAGNLRLPNFDQPRKSSETEQRYLLSESIAPSESASVITDYVDGDGDCTLRAHSPVRQQGADALQHQSVAAPEGISAKGSYRGFSSEEAYLDALRAWAEGHKYTDPTTTTLVGFYGTTTMAEYASRPPAFQPLWLKKKWKAMKVSRQEERQRRASERRATVTLP